MFETNQPEYTCAKCGSVCEPEPDEDHPGSADCWCDTCNDYPGGWLMLVGSTCPADQFGIDFLTDRIDHAMDQAKDDRLFGRTPNA